MQMSAPDSGISELLPLFYQGLIRDHFMRGQTISLTIVAS
jgi:hypothetical protein